MEMDSPFTLFSFTQEDAQSLDPVATIRMGVTTNCVKLHVTIDEGDQKHTSLESLKAWLENESRIPDADAPESNSYTGFYMSRDYFGRCRQRTSESSYVLRLFFPKGKLSGEDLMSFLVQPLFEKIAEPDLTEATQDLNTTIHIEQIRSGAYYTPVGFENIPVTQSNMLLACQTFLDQTMLLSSEKQIDIVDQIIFSNRTTRPSLLAGQVSFVGGANGNNQQGTPSTSTQSTQPIY